MDQYHRNLVAELQSEAIKDGDPETCLGWEAAEAIKILDRRAAGWKAVARELHGFMRAELDPDPMPLAAYLTGRRAEFYKTETSR